MDEYQVVRLGRFTDMLNLGWAGMACWCLSLLIGNFHVN
jgi:hypothetical protein